MNGTRMDVRRMGTWRRTRLPDSAAAGRMLVASGIGDSGTADHRSGTSRAPGTNVPANRPRPAKGHPLAAMVFVVAFLAGCAGGGTTLSAPPNASIGPSPSAQSPAASAAVAEPALHPKGTIVFLRTTGDDDHTYYTANADGTDERQLTQAGECGGINRVSPDRSQILVIPEGHMPTPITGGLLTIDGTVFTVLQLNDPTLNLVPQAWSPAGKALAFEGWSDSDATRTGIYTGGFPDVTDLARLTSTDGAPHDTPLDYSPDGKALVFYRATRAEPDFPIDIGGSLWVVNVDGTDARQLDTPPPNWWARWAPDGTSILFVSERNQPTGAIWTIRPDGSRLTKVYEDPSGRFPIDPVWSPDGTQIMFMLDPISDRFTHPNNVLYVMRSDGTGLTKLIDTPDFKSSPEWWSP
jgi:WD40-like Beta Propeller Repeat